MKNTCKFCSNSLSKIDNFGSLSHIKGCFSCNIYSFANEIRRANECLFFLFEKYSIYVNLNENYSFIHTLYNPHKLIDKKLLFFRDSGLEKTFQSVEIKNTFIPTCEEDIENFLILI